MRAAHLTLTLALAVGGCADPAPLDLTGGDGSTDGDAEVLASPPANTGLPPGAADPTTGGVDTYPFDFDAYQQVVAPLLEADCATGVGCHGGYGTARGGTFGLHEAPADAATHYANFLVVRDFVSLDDPRFSLLLLEAIDDSPHAGGPIYADADPAYATLLAWILEAADAKVEDQAEIAPPAAAPPPPVAPIPTPTGAPPCDTPDPLTSRYDLATFAQTVQPIYDADCATAGCHATPGAAGGLELRPAAEGDCAVRRNFFISQRFTFPRNVAQSTLLLKPLALSHTGGRIFGDEADARYRAIHAWIAGVGEPQGGAAEAPDEAAFDYVVFQQQVAPWLLAQGSPHNCADRSCHGADDEAARGRLYLVADPAQGSAAMAQDFLALAGFADPGRPDASPLLAKAAGAEGHRVVLTPDAEAWEAVADWMRRARGALPLDPVYFAERVMPIYDDPDHVGGAGQQLTCAAVGRCHGTYDPAAGPAIASRFGIIPAADTAAARRYNFDQSAAMVSLSRPERSPLLLHPLHADDGGLPHGGGDNWRADSAAYAAIWRWIDGLAPTDNGYVREWVVLGALDDAAAGPDPATAQAAYGEAWGAYTWQARLSDDDHVTLGGAGTWYLGAWMMNTTGAPLEVDVFFGADGTGEVWLGGQMVLADRDDGAADTGNPEVAPALALAPGANRVMLRITTGADGGRLFFRLRARDAAALGRRIAVRLGGVDEDAPIGDGGGGGGGGDGGGGDDGGGGGGGDGGGGGGGGGQGDSPYDALDREVFTASVLPVLASAGGGCASDAGCHQNRAGGFYYDDAWRNDEAVTDRILRGLANPRLVNLATPEASAVLTAPLAGSDNGHGGGKAWASTNDPGYRAILAWIQDASP